MVNITKKFWVILSKRQKIQIIPLIIMMLFGGIMESLSVSLILPLISAIMSSNNWNSTWYSNIICNIFNVSSQKQYIEVLLILLIIIFIVKNLYLLFEYYVQFAYIANGRYQMQKRLMEIYMYKPYNFFLGASTGEILRIVANDTGQAFNLLKMVLSFYTEIIVGIILAVTVFFVSPSIAILIGVTLGIEFLIISNKIKPIMREMGERQRNEGALANKWFLQAFNGIKSIKVENKEEYFCNNYNEHAKVLFESDKMSQMLSNVPRLFIEACTMTVVFCFILVMIEVGVPMQNIVPQLSAFAVAAIRLLPSVNRISSSINEAPFSEGGLDNLIKTIQTENECEHLKISENTSAFDPIIFKNSIELRKIEFSYSTNAKKIIDNANMIIYKGQSVGIIGTSGAGKTTVVDIILGLLRPQVGVVEVDGVNIKNNIVSWRSHLAYIPQHIFLMDDTIRKNIAFGEDDKNIDDNAIWEALQEAQMDEFVKSLPDGINTYVGEQGVRLSGGQRQRIGIARALYHRPDLLIFDEATSALDSETELAIMASINSLKGKKTMIIIAHRLSTIQNCDVVYEVKNGKIEKSR